MSKFLNIDSEKDAGIVGADATPTLTLHNISTGPGAKVDKLVGVSGASIDRLTISNKFAGVAAATVVALNLTGNSIASGAILSFINNSAFVSTTTIDVTLADQTSGAIRIVKPDGTFGWIPVYTDAQVTAVVV
jgi:hypothetical protein